MKNEMVVSIVHIKIEGHRLSSLSTHVGDQKQNSQYF